MNPTYRCVIFAAVSTKPQAEDDRASIPSQIANARDFIERRGWQEVHDPLVVPGRTRSIDFLHEAIEDVPAIADLVRLARQDEIDLVICRDYDRLARTSVLLMQVSSYFSRCKVQIYSMEKPVEPLPLDQLNRRGTGVQSSAMVEAFAGLDAEAEVARIVNRRHFGMNSRMRAGRWRYARVAFGYTRVDPDRSTDEKTVYADIPLVVPEKAAIVRRIERMYLDGSGITALTRSLNLAGVPGPRGKWHSTTICSTLGNPFYCGYIVWGLTRSVKEARALLEESSS